MKNRRQFIKTISAALGTTPILLKLNKQDSIEKKITIGIIGAENSHTVQFGKLFNIDKKFPNVELKYIWGETEELALKAMKAGAIPNLVKDPREMLGNINALIVDHRHAKFHLPAARPFVEAGIPTFIDKPFCYTSEEGKEFLQFAKQKGTPITSFSTIAYATSTFELKEIVKNTPQISQVVSTGTADFESEYGGIFFYGMHVIEPLMTIFGEDITSVKVTRNGKQGTANLKFTSGLWATLIFKSKVYGWETFIETNKEFIQLIPKSKESDPTLHDRAIVEMFRTGKEPRTHQSILNTICVLEALEKSGNTEAWTDVKYHILS